MKSYNNLEEIILNIQNDTSGFSTQLIVNNLIDPLFWVSQKTIGENLMVLNQSRNLMRNKKLIEGKEKFSIFQRNWRDLREMTIQFRKESEKVHYNKKLLKLIDTLLELIEQSTQKPVMSKFIVPDIDLLQVEATEIGIDWIIKKIKSYLNKFAQVYASTRVYYLLSDKLNEL